MLIIDALLMPKRSRDFRGELIMETIKQTTHVEMNVPLMQSHLSTVSWIKNILDIKQTLYNPRVTWQRTMPKMVDLILGRISPNNHLG